LKFLGFANQQKSDSGLGCSSCPPFYLNCRRFVRLFPTGARGEAATLRPPISVCGVLLLAETRLPALPDAQARQRQDRELSFYAVGDGRDARPLQGRAVGAGT